MITAERNSLHPLKKLVSQPLIQLELLENSKGELFLSSRSEEPGGVVCFAITPVLLCSFLENSITLQSLFDHSPTLFVEISNTDKTALYSREDIDVKLAFGEKSFIELVRDQDLQDLQDL